MKNIYIAKRNFIFEFHKLKNFNCLGLSIAKEHEDKDIFKPQSYQFNLLIWKYGLHITYINKQYTK